MRTVALAFSSSSSSSPSSPSPSPSPPFQPLPAATPSNPTPPLHHNLRIKKLHFPAKLWVNRSRRRGNSGGGEDVVLSGSLFPRIPYKSGFCMASQSVELFPSICPGVIVRDARIEDCWEVADTHCSSFFPDYRFPLDLLLRIDRFVAMLSGFSVPPGCMRTCLVAITGSTVDDNLSVGFEDFKIGVLEGKFSFNRGSVAGILTVDTVADFLPRKGPLLQRRTGIAYVSNVAVRETERRKGIAKRLVAKAEVRARSWGCRAIALHCDANSLAATRLYRGQGFKRIKVAERASWPQPKTTPGIQFNLMMKLLVPSTGRDSIDKR